MDKINRKLWEGFSKFIAGELGGAAYRRFGGRVQAGTKSK